MEGIQTASCQKHQHSAGDTSPTSDTTMKHGQMSPTANPTTPSKGASRGGTPEPSLSVPSDKHAKRDAYKAQKRTYRSQKKEAAKELLSTITDPAVVLLGDWLKVRGTLKSWTKLWCVLKPGLLILYKSDKHKGSQWVGTILLNTCQLLERPSKKDGFCFKLFHPLDQSIWATKGPKGETIGAFVQPLPYSYCIFRAPSESAGKCWMDALELALKCTSLLKRSLTRLDSASDTTVDYNSKHSLPQSGGSWPAGAAGEEGPVGQNNTGHDHSNDAFTHSYSSMRAQEGSMDDSDLERHFANQGVDRVSEADKNVVKQRGGRGHSSLLDSDSRSTRGLMLCPKCRSSTPELAHYNKGGKSPGITYKLGKKSCPISDMPPNKMSSKETERSADMTQKPQKAGDGSSWDNPGVFKGSDPQKAVMHVNDGENSLNVKDSFQLKNSSAGFQKFSGLEEKPGQKMSDTNRRIAWKSSINSGGIHQESPPLSSPVDVKKASLKGSLQKFRSLLPRSVQSLPAFHFSRDRSLSVPISTVAKPVEQAVNYAPRQMSGQGKGEHAASCLTCQDIQDSQYSLSASSMKMAYGVTAPLQVDTEVSNAIPPSSPINQPMSLHQPLSSDKLYETSMRMDKIPNSISSLTNRLPGRGNSITNLNQPLISGEPHLFSAGLPETRSPLTKAETNPGRATVQAMPATAIAETKPETASLISSPSFERMLQNKRHQLKKVGCLQFEYDPAKEKKPESALLSSTEFVVGESSAKTMSPSPCSSNAPSSLSLGSQSWKDKSMYSVSDAKHKKPVYFGSDGKRSPTGNESISSGKELRICHGGKSPERGISCSQSIRCSTPGDYGQQEWQAKGEGTGTVRQKILKFSLSSEQHPCMLHCSCMKARCKNNAHTVDQGTQTSDHGIYQYSDSSRPGSGDKKSVQLLSVLKKTDFSPSSPVPIMQNMLYTLADTDSDSQSQYTTVSSESQSSQTVSDETGSATNSKSGLEADQTSEGSQTTAESDSGESSSSSSGSERSDPKSKSSLRTEKKTVRKKKAARKDADSQSQTSQTSMSDSPLSTSVNVSHKAGSAGVRPTESQTSTDHNTSANASPIGTCRRKVFPGSTFVGNRSFSNSIQQPGKIDTRVKRGGRVLVYQRKGHSGDRYDSKNRKKSGSRSSAQRAEGGEGKKQKKRSKSTSGSSSGSGGKSGDEAGKKKKKKKSDAGESGKKSETGGSAGEGDKKKKKKKKKEGAKEGDTGEAGEKGEKKKKKKKKKHGGDEGEKQEDKEGGEGKAGQSGDDAHKKKKKKKKKDEGGKSGDEGEKEKDKGKGEGESGDEAHKKKKKKKKKHGAEGDTEKSGDEGEKKKDQEGEGESGEGAKKKKKKKKKEDGEPGSTEKSDGTAPEGEGHKKKKKKKKKDGEAEGEKSGSDGEGEKKKKKKKKSKEEGDIDSIAAPIPAPEPPKEEAEGKKPVSDVEGGKKKKKKKKKKKEGEAEGETSGSDVEEEKKKKKKKKKSKEEGEVGSVPAPIPAPIPPPIPSPEPPPQVVDVKPSPPPMDSIPVAATSGPPSIPPAEPPPPPIKVKKEPVTAAPQENVVSDVASVSQPVSSASPSQTAETPSATTPSSAASTTTEYMEQITSTSENEDIVFELPFFLQKFEAWRDSEEPKVDHFKSMSDLSQLCPKCVEALKKQGLTDELFGHVGDSGGTSEPPVFVSQKFKMVPKDDAKYSSEPTPAPGAASAEEPSSIKILPSHAGPAQGISCDQRAASGNVWTPTQEELQYITTSAQLRKLMTQRQKLELEKTNLRLDILAKEEHLNKEYGVGNWLKLLPPDPADPPFAPCSKVCTGACMTGRLCSPAKNRSQNRQDSTTTSVFPYGQIDGMGWWSDSDQEQELDSCEHCGGACGQAEGRSFLDNGWTADENSLCEEGEGLAVLDRGWMEDEGSQHRQEHSYTYRHPQLQEHFDSSSSCGAYERNKMMVNNHCCSSSDLQRKHVETEAKSKSCRGKVSSSKWKKVSGEQRNEKKRVMKRWSWSILAFKLSK